MNIGIIGSGRVGQALAQGFVAQGHHVMLGTRNPEKVELREWAQSHNIEVGTLPAAATFGEVLVVATPWANGATENAVQLADPKNFVGKTVIDTTNPLVTQNGKLQLALGWNTSAAEMIQSWLPGAHVVKAFNIVGAETMTDAQRTEGTPDLLIAGDDADAKNTVATLARAFGWDVIDAGALDRARLLESLGLLWVDYARTNKIRTHAFKLLKK